MLGIDDAPGTGDLHEYGKAHTEILLAQGDEGSLEFPVEGAAVLRSLRGLGSRDSSRSPARW